MPRRTDYGCVVAGIAASVALAYVPSGWADEHDEGPEFEVAEVFTELNDTDGDLGLHALIDGDEWILLKIRDPDGRRVLKVKARGSVGEQGLTEFFFESAEPTFDELTPVEFFERFPEGEYELEGTSVDGEEMEAETEFTHVVPAPPEAFVDGS